MTTVEAELRILFGNLSEEFARVTIQRVRANWTVSVDQGIHKPVLMGSNPDPIEAFRQVFYAPERRKHDLFGPVETRI